jgi:hypothetical protein
MIENDNGEKNLRRLKYHYYHRSTTNMTTKLQQRKTSTNTKLSNQQFKQALLPSS